MTLTTLEAPRSLDHLVLPTANLDTARARLKALGFTVAPKGAHPFGTENCCVYFADGTFLEPLAVGDRIAADKAAVEKNVFVGRDRVYRELHGDEGFSAVVFGTDDADADHRRYLAAGVSAGNRLDFSRPFIDADGKSDIVSFRLAFAADGDPPDAFFFTCERVNAPKVDRAALQAHANGVTRIVEVVAVSDDPPGRRRLLGAAADASEAGKQTTGGKLSLSNATLTILDPAAFETRFGVPAGEPSALRFAAIEFSVTRLGVLKNLLAANAVEYDMRDNRIVVRPAPGQGAAFVFRERT